MDITYWDGSNCLSIIDNGLKHLVYLAKAIYQNKQSDILIRRWTDKESEGYL
jgi:hypothetical protein